MPTALSTLDSRDVLANLVERFEAAETESYAAGLCMPMPSDRETEQYADMFGIGSMNEWTGERIAQELAARNYFLRNRPFEKTLAVGVDEKRRDKVGVVDIRIGELVEVYQTHPDELMADDILNAGTFGNGMDGTPFFGNAHPVGVRNRPGVTATQINNLTKAQVPALQVANPNRVTAAEFAAAIAGVRAYMSRFLDTAGRACMKGAREFGVMYSPELGEGPMTALNQISLSGQTPNPLAVMEEDAKGKLRKRFRFDPLENAYLTDPAVGFMFRLDSAIKPFIMQVEVPLEFSVQAEGSPAEHYHRRHEYGIFRSYAIGFGKWQHAVRFTFST